MSQPFSPLGTVGSAEASNRLGALWKTVIPTQLPIRLQRPSEQVSGHQRGFRSLKGAGQAFTVSSCDRKWPAGPRDIQPVEDTRLVSPGTSKAYLAMFQAFSDSEIRCQSQRPLRRLPVSPRAECYPVASSWVLLVDYILPYLGHVCHAKWALAAEA